MSDSRERFEAWRDAQHKYLEPADFWPWIEEAWMQAEAGAVRRCAEICQHEANRQPRKGTPGYTSYTEGAADWAEQCADAIRAEFPEAFK
jgi:hypothetical protein